MFFKKDKQLSISTLSNFFHVFFTLSKVSGTNLTQENDLAIATLHNLYEKGHFSYSLSPAEFLFVPKSIVPLCYNQELTQSASFW